MLASGRIAHYRMPLAATKLLAPFFGSVQLEAALAPQLAEEPSLFSHVTGYLQCRRARKFTCQIT